MYLEIILIKPQTLYLIHLNYSCLITKNLSINDQKEDKLKTHSS